MKSNKNVNPNPSNPQEPAFTEMQLIRYYNLSLIAIKVIYDRADDGNTECVKALRRISVALLTIAGRLVAHEGYEEK